MNEISALIPLAETEAEGELVRETVLPDVAAELVALRKEAVEERAASGIEAKWRYAEDAYNGEDEATRNRAKMYKPSGPDAPFIVVSRKEWSRSTAFINITRPFVDSSAARASDMLFPTDDRNWEIKPTPKVEAENALLALNAIPDDAAAAMLQEQIEYAIGESHDAVAEAQRQIDDWLTECQWNASGRKALADAARIGTCVVKGPVPMEVGGKIQPGSKIVKAQNCYPDPACGENIHDGDYFFEREDITSRKLKQKAKLESAGWLSAQIIACLAEGPKAYNGVTLTNLGKPVRLYELWHFQGEVSVHALLECGCSVPHSGSDAEAKVWANVTLCNDYIVRISLSPLPDQFVYQVLCWQKRDGFWAGIGVGEQMETPQRGLNGAIRNLFDNSALSALPQIIHWQGIIEPTNGVYELAPGKHWRVSDDVDLTINDVKNAIMTIEIPSRQAELMEIIALMRDLAQETTGLPWIMQGQSSSGQVGTDQLQTNAASTILRRIAKDYDDGITVPHIQKYVDWINEFEILHALDAIVHARGSAVLVERDIQAQALIQMVQLSKDPTYGMDPKLVAVEWLKSQKFDPKKVALSPEREEQLNAMLAQPDEKAQAAIQSAQIRAQALTNQAGVEAETDRIELGLKQEDADRDRVHDKVMLDLQYKYKLIEYSMQRNIDLADAQAQLESVKIPELAAEAAFKPKAEAKEKARAKA